MRGQEQFPTSVLTVGIHYAAEVSRHSIHYRFTTVGRGSGIEWEERTSRFYGLFVRTGKDHGYVLRAGMLTSRLELKIKSMNVYIFDLDLNSRLCKRLPKAQTSSVTKDCRCVQKNVLMSVSHTSAKKGDLDTERLRTWSWGSVLKDKDKKDKVNFITSKERSPIVVNRITCRRIALPPKGFVIVASMVQLKDQSITHPPFFQNCCPRPRPLWCIGDVKKD